MKEVLFILLFILSHSMTCFGTKSGFILTAPKALDAGNSEMITLSLFNIRYYGDITLKLLKRDSNTVLMQSKVHARNNYITSTFIKVPDIKDSFVRLRIESSLNPIINATKEIQIRHTSVIIFIETDKPIYKPGETVKFRILPVDTWLYPLNENVTGDVWIEDPNGIRISQWRNVDFSEKIVQLELPLSEEPVFGSWKINVRIKGITNTQDFKIDEYVLPKFEITINPPPYVMADAQDIQTHICAQYTYGKKVDGYLKAKVTYQSFYENENIALPFVEYKGMISGCTEFSVKAEDIALHFQDFSYRKIKIFAEVVENSTDIKQNSSAVVEIKHSPLNIEFLGAKQDSHYFKPGLPYYGALRITKPDGTIASSEHVKICAKPKKKVQESNTELCNSFISDREGKVHFIIPSQATSIYTIFLEAKTFHEEKFYGHYGSKQIETPYASIHLKQWHSPSNSHLQIEPITKVIECGKYDENIKIRYTTTEGSEIKFFHQVISGGNVVQHGFTMRSFSMRDKVSLDPDDGRMLRIQRHRNSHTTATYTGIEELDDDNDDQDSSFDTSVIGEFTLKFALNGRTSMSPISRFLVYYVRNDGEVVADTRAFHISGCFKNKVKLHFRHSQQLPSTEAALFLSASPNSLCGISIIDKSVNLLAKEKKFDRHKVFQLLETFNLDKSTLPKQKTSFCQSDGNDKILPYPGPLPPPWLKRRKRMIMLDMRAMNEYVDTIMAFEEAGMVVITNFDLETRPCPHFAERENRLRIHDLAGPYGPPGLSAFAPIAFSVRDNADAFDLPPKPEQKSELEIRSFFPETWLWEMHNVSSSGEIVLERNLPHTITQWTGKAVCVNSEQGLGISDEVNITVFQPFFVSFTLPYSVIRGEIVPVTVTVFNYLSECLPVKLSIPLSESFKIVDHLPSHKLCVCGEESVSWSFRIRPLDLGIINITVYAYSLPEDPVCENEITAKQSARDAVTHPLLVEAEGFPKEDTINLYFCPEKSNRIFFKEIELFIPGDSIDDSARGYVSVTGDLMGPALNGLESLVRLPVGCGEQNMVLFTPNIYILNYLTATKRITDEIKYKAISHLKTGYQRELKYKHDDGSYSAFGKSDEEGSMWLTAFVVKSFAQARRHISIDEGDLATSTAWIVLQQLENGCFPATGYLFNKALKGGLTTDDNSLSPLTAFVLISLLESNFRDETTINSALLCLKSEKFPSTYSLALFAYAAALAKSNDTNSYLDFLNARAIKGDHLQYWEHDDKYSKAINVEIAGYVILAMIEFGGTEYLPKAMPIVRWITQQRNSNGGFISTQDTVIALQALATYGSQSSSEKIDMKVTVDTNELEHIFKIDESSKFLMQSIKVPSIPTVLEIQAVGQGCALTQFVVKYNIKNSPEMKSFDLKVTTVRSEYSGCNAPIVQICMRYNVFGQVTNMVIVEVKMVSGYVPDEFELHMLHNDKSLELRRHDVKNNKVIFYFSKLTYTRKCFEFSVKNEVYVEEYKPSLAKIYDYYQPELQTEVSYEIPINCTMIEPDIISSSPLPNEGTEFSTTEEFSTTNFPNENDITNGNSGERETENYITSINAEMISSSNDNESTLRNNIEPEKNTNIDIETTTLTSMDVSSLKSTIEESDTLVPEDSQPPDILYNFIDSDLDLDFPNGEESNEPVYVLPPK